MSFSLADYNAKYIYVFTIVFGSAYSIISQLLVGEYAYSLCNLPFSSASTENIQVIAQLLLVIPAGFAVDYFRRDRIILLAAISGIIASAASAMAFHQDQTSIMTLAFIFWGVFMACILPAINALLGDSVPMGYRSGPFTVMFVLEHIGKLSMPCFALAIYTRDHDSLEPQELRPVVFVGALMAGTSMLILLRLNDDMAHENKQYIIAMERELSSIARNFEDESSSNCTSLGPDSVSFDQEMTIGSDLRNYNSAPPGILTPSAGNELSRLLPTPALETPTYRPLYTLSAYNEPLTTYAVHESSIIITAFGFDSGHVPFLLLYSNVLIQIADGLTVPNLVLYFITKLEVSFIHVFAMQLGQLLLVCVMACVIQKQSRENGRMPMVVITRLLSVACLVCIMVVPSVKIQCALFVLRGAFYNCADPLRLSLLIDFVNKSTRGRWVAAFALPALWSMTSAKISEQIVDSYGISWCFMIATIVSSLGIATEAILIPLTRHTMEHPTPSKH